MYRIEILTMQMVFEVLKPTHAFLYHDQHQGGTFSMMAIHRAGPTDKKRLLCLNLRLVLQNENKMQRM